MQNIPINQIPERILRLMRQANGICRPRTPFRLPGPLGCRIKRHTDTKNQLSKDNLSHIIEEVLNGLGVENDPQLREELIPIIDKLSNMAHDNPKCFKNMEERIENTNSNSTNSSCIYEPQNNHTTSNSTLAIAGSGAAISGGIMTLYIIFVVLVLCMIFGAAGYVLYSHNKKYGNHDQVEQDDTERQKSPMKNNTEDLQQNHRGNPRILELTKNKKKHSHQTHQ